MCLCECAQGAIILAVVGWQALQGARNGTMRRVQARSGGRGLFLALFCLP